MLLKDFFSLFNCRLFSSEFDVIYWILSFKNSQCHCLREKSPLETVSSQKNFPKQNLNVFLSLSLLHGIVFHEEVQNSFSYTCCLFFLHFSVSLQASVTTDDVKEVKGSREESSSRGRSTETSRVNSIRNGKSSSSSTCPSTTTASVVILSKGVSTSSSSSNGNKTVSSSNGNGGLLIRQLSNKVSSSNGSNINNNNNNGDVSSKKKRPPTPPRKPKINPQNFPGLQFMGKEGFGVADNLSTPPNSLPVSPTEDDGVFESRDSTPDDTTNESSSSVVNNNGNNNHTKDSHSIAQVSSTTDKKQHLKITPRVIDSMRSKSCEQKSQCVTEESIPTAIESNTPLLRALSEIERGSDHSLASADLEEDDLNPMEEALRDALLKEDEERSINEDLSLHDGLTEHLEVCLLFPFCRSC